jgi:DNA-directed RNA polymerase specialized sigma24 family protein
MWMTVPRWWRVWGPLTKTGRRRLDLGFKCLQLFPMTPGLLGDSTMDDGRQSDFSFAKLGARRLGMRELLADAIADLPERERLVFTLYYYEELETSEIALVLGETLFAVVQLHVSALGRLKARLADAEKTGCRSPS